MKKLAPAALFALLLLSLGSQAATRACGFVSLKKESFGSSNSRLITESGNSYSLKNIDLLLQRGIPDGHRICLALEENRFNGDVFTVTQILDEAKIQAAAKSRFSTKVYED